jgi:hypothetical protein
MVQPWKLSVWKIRDRAVQLTAASKDVTTPHPMLAVPVSGQRSSSSLFE